MKWIETYRGFTYEIWAGCGGINCFVHSRDGERDIFHDTFYDFTAAKRVAENTINRVIEMERHLMLNMIAIIESEKRRDA